MPVTTNKIPEDQIKAAVKALFAYLQKKAEGQTSSKALFEDDEFVSLSFALKRTPERTKTMPMPMYVFRCSYCFSASYFLNILFLCDSLMGREDVAT